MNILEAMTDPKLFQKTFQPKKGLMKLLKKAPAVDTWASWRVFLAALFGLGITAEGKTVYEQHTGRSDTPSSQFREAYVVAGRRSGKSLIASLIAVYMATLRDYREVLNAGEVGVVMILGADRKQCRTIFNYIVAFLEAPLLRSLVVAKRKESIDLCNGIRIEIHTSNYKSVRGVTLICAICDELAFWSDENSANPDVEIVRALVPSMITIPGALLLGISSPYAKTGQLYNMYRENFGKPSDVLVWQGDSLSMNPTLPAKVVERALDRDRAAASAEYLAVFRDDIGGFLSVEEIERVIVPGRTLLPCISGQQYRAFCDPSGGRSDSMCLAIAHAEAERAVLDLLREIRAPFSPEEAVREFGKLLKAYHISEVHGDRYSAQWVTEAFERYGIRYLPSEKNRSELYLEFLPALTSGQIELLDDQRMKLQFVGLQRRTSGAGRDAVDHPVGSHDDLSNATAGAVCQILRANSLGTLGLLDLGREYETGARPLPASVDEKFVVKARHDGYATIKKGEVRPTCPKCGLLAQCLAVLGGWWCNTCNVSMDSAGKLTISEEELGCKPGCAGFVKQWAGGRVFCGNCHGFYTPAPKVVGVGRGDYEKGVGRSRWRFGQFAIRGGGGKFPWESSGRF